MTTAPPSAFARMRTMMLGTFGLAGWFFLGCLLIVPGSFALEAWTGWPDIVTIGLMVVFVLVAPPLAGLLALVGLFYLPFW